MAKNRAAVGMGKLRWKGKTKAQRRAHMKMMSDKAAAARKKKRRRPPAHEEAKP